MVVAAGEARVAAGQRPCGDHEAGVAHLEELHLARLHAQPRARRRRQAAAAAGALLGQPRPQPLVLAAEDHHVHGQHQQQDQEKPQQAGAYPRPQRRSSDAPLAERRVLGRLEQNGVVRAPARALVGGRGVVVRGRRARPSLSAGGGGRRRAGGRGGGRGGGGGGGRGGRGWGGGIWNDKNIVVFVFDDSSLRFSIPVKFHPNCKRPVTPRGEKVTA